MNIGEKYFCSKCMMPMVEEATCPHCGYDPTQPVMSRALEEGTLLCQGRYLLGAVISADDHCITYAGWDHVQELPVKIFEYFPVACQQRDVAEDDCLKFVSLDAEVLKAYMRGMKQFLGHRAESIDAFRKNCTEYIVEEFTRERRK